jgi:hypothetical protein
MGAPQNESTNHKSCDGQFDRYDVDHLHYRVVGAVLHMAEHAEQERLLVCGSSEGPQRCKSTKHIRPSIDASRDILLNSTSSASPSTTQSP